jgi:hypothetical protein
MKQFTDAEGRTWEVAVNVNAVKRVRDLAGVDLLDAAGNDLLSRLAADPCLLVNVIFALVKPQADAAKVSDESFGRAMIGDVLDAASAALVQDLLAFFPRAQRLRALGRLGKALQEREAEAAGLLAAAEAAGLPAAAEAATNPVAPEPPASGKSSISVPGPSDATPAP